MTRFVKYGYIRTREIDFGTVRPTGARATRHVFLPSGGEMSKWLRGTLRMPPDTTPIVGANISATETSAAP